MKQTWTRFFLSLLLSGMYEEYAHTRFFFGGGGKSTFDTYLARKEDSDFFCNILFLFLFGRAIFPQKESKKFVYL